MRLYQSIGPNPRVVTMFIPEKGIAVPRQTVDIMTGENRQPRLFRASMRPVACRPSGATTTP